MSCNDGNRLDRSKSLRSRTPMDKSHQFVLDVNSVRHPGETVLEYLDFHDWSQRDLARRTDLSPKTVSEICNGKAAISPNTALSFEKAFRRPAHLWLNLQSQFDEAVARRVRTNKSQQWGEWCSNFPLKEMRELRFSLPEGDSDIEVLLGFLGVYSPESWDSLWTASAVAYRQTRVFSAHEAAIAAWVREAEIIAGQLHVEDFDEAKLRDSINELKSLTRRPADQIFDSVQQICARSGIAVVLVPGLRNTGISGCARWLTNKKALIGLTLRYKTDDQLWFTLLHEIGHILLHKRQCRFVVDNATENLSDNIVDPAMQMFEAEANHFSANTLIPPKELGEFIQSGVFTNESIHDFAEMLEIGPGIVVGRLQFEGILQYHQGNALKQRINWSFIE